MGNDSRNLAADRHIGLRIELACRRHELNQIAASYNLSLVLGFAITATLPIPPTATDNHPDNGENDNPFNPTSLLLCHNIRKLRQCSR